ncbi:MAG: hypothetical protein ACTHMG_16350 [Sphingomonas sp.]
MTRAALLLALLSLAACGQQQHDASGAGESNAGARLEQAAITTGVVADPDRLDLTGVYARDPERVCVVPAAKDFRIGVSVDYGQGQQCSGAGTLARDGEALHVDLGQDCRFDARFDDGRIDFPGALPSGCDALCTGRASLAGVAVDSLGTSLSEAQALRDAHGRLLCGDAG